VRIDILPTATWHSITHTEIRTIINHYELRIHIEPRNPKPDVEADDYLHIGRAADNQPHIEIIADFIDPTVAVVFHAMMLRPTTVAELSLESYGFHPDYAPQRPYIGP
jgi:hypothetical protein